MHRHSLPVSRRVSPLKTRAAEAVTRLVHARKPGSWFARTVSHVTYQRRERTLVQHRPLERLCSKLPRILLRISNKLLRDLCLQPDDARALSSRTSFISAERTSDLRTAAELFKSSAAYWPITWISSDCLEMFVIWSPSYSVPEDLEIQIMRRYTYMHCRVMKKLQIYVIVM